MVVAFTLMAALRNREEKRHKKLRHHRSMVTGQHFDSACIQVVGKTAYLWKKKGKKRYISRNMRGLQQPFPPYRCPITAYTLRTRAQVYSTEVRRVKTLRKIYIYRLFRGWCWSTFGGPSHHRITWNDASKTQVETRLKKKKNKLRIASGWNASSMWR